MFESAKCCTWLLRGPQFKTREQKKRASGYGTFWRDSAHSYNQLMALEDMEHSFDLTPTPQRPYMDEQTEANDQLKAQILEINKGYEEAAVAETAEFEAGAETAESESEAEAAEFEAGAETAESESEAETAEFEAAESEAKKSSVARRLKKGLAKSMGKEGGTPQVKQKWADLVMWAQTSAKPIKEGGNGRPAPMDLLHGAGLVQSFIKSGRAPRRTAALNETMAILDIKRHTEQASPEALLDSMNPPSRFDFDTVVKGLEPGVINQGGGVNGTTTALFTAVTHNNPDKVHKLLKQGATIDNLSSRLAGTEGKEKVNSVFTAYNKAATTIQGLARRGLAQRKPPRAGQATPPAAHQKPRGNPISDRQAGA